MTTVAPLIGQMFVIGHEENAKIYSTPAGVMISYDYFKSCIDRVHEEAKSLYHTSEESVNTLGDGWAQTNHMNTSLIQKLRELSQQNKWAVIAICILALAVVVLAILLVAL